VETFLQVSTDEVYGSVDSGSAGEDAPLDPSSPYSASKAAADLLVGSYRTTFGYPALITRCTNNFGPYQFPEKVIPLFVTNLLDGIEVPVYGDGLNERDWLHVDDHCAALQTVIRHGGPGEIYNIGADARVTNLELTRQIIAIMGASDSSIRFVADRPGHDRRYAVDSTKIRSLGWAPEHSLAERLTETVEWYRSHAPWWRPLREATG
jgi:dTDP-glucose 4,6-dehydratase